MSRDAVITVGWREWVSLPALGLPAIKAKIDTGARTSALHAYYLDSFRRSGKDMVRFGIRPVQRRTSPEVQCEAVVLDRRRVTDSGGHRELRYVIETAISFAGEAWPIEVTLTNRDTMLFRMLVGRTGLAPRVIVDPGRSYVTGRPSRKHVIAQYRTRGTA